MSLVIHTIVRDGIVVSADIRATCKDGYCGENIGRIHQK